MLRPSPHIRYHIAAILVVDPVFSGAAHWIQFVVQYKRWIRPKKPGCCNTGIMKDWVQ